MTGSVLFYVQHLLGIGHLQRSLRIAEALAGDGIAVTVVSGGMPVTGLRTDPLVTIVQMPPVRALDARFDLVDELGEPLGERLRATRQRALLTAFAATRPAAVVVEGFPFARRAFGFELDPLIAAVHATAPRPRLISSVRDILVLRDDPARHREVVERVRRHFDLVLVHGDPRLIPFEASFPAAPQIADRLVYTGYVGPSAGHLRPVGNRREVLVSAGGGAAGLALLRAALQARQQGCLAGAPWRLVCGTNLPENDVAELRDAAPPGVVIERFRGDFVDLLHRCRVSVSQAGYNTALEILGAASPAVLVPFAAERETEQLMRAQRLHALGAAELVRESELTPDRLTAAIERADARGPVRIPIDSDGASRSARTIGAAIRGDDTRTGNWPWLRAGI